jgi:hypothetical protein
MKLVKVLAFLAIPIVMITNIGCQKDPTSTQANVGQRPSPPPPVNTAPKSFAGPDQVIFFPTNFCILNGNASDAENNIRAVLWRKVSGPPSFLIEHPNSIFTKLSDLEIGVYQFELTVTDSLGLFEKDTIKVIVNAATISPSSTTINAGADKIVHSPTNSTFLGGGLSGALTSNQTILWSKISGPSTFIIESPNSLRTKVSNLQMGVYQFEVRIQDNVGLIDKDTCSIIVGQLSNPSKEFLFTNQVWVQDGLLWGSAITIKNVYQNLPVGSVFRVYIRRDNSTDWVELEMDNYNSYYLTDLVNGNLSLWSSFDESDSPDIKLVF